MPKSPIVPNRRSLTIGSLNVCSLRNKVDQISTLITQESLDILLLNETWLSTTIDNSEVNVPGYALYRNDRNGRQGGGTAVYIRETIQASFRSDLLESHPELEMCWLEIVAKSRKDKPLLIGTVYRPPLANTDYSEKILDMLDSISTEGLDIVLTGDLNYNYLEEITKRKVVYIENLYSMKQIVTKPTRQVLTKNTETGRLSVSSTLIDVILTTCPGNHTYTHVKDYTISDHNLIKTQLCFQAVHTHKTITFRTYSKFDAQKFQIDLKRLLDSENIVGTASTEEAWNKFKKVFNSVCNDHAPLRTSRMKARKNQWITSELVKEMYRRDHLKDLTMRLKTQESFKEYKAQRNKVTSLVRNAKRAYFHNLVENHTNSSVWNILHEVLPTKYSDQKPTTMSADQFATYFTNVGASISRSFTSQINPTTSQDNNNTTIKAPACLYKFKLTPITTKELKQLMSQLSAKSSNDIIGMDSKLLKISTDIIAPILVYIINLSIEQSVVVPDWKIARVSPVYKGKGSRNEVSHYRPISNVGHIAKLIEKVINSQLTNYLEKHKFISKDQSAYLKGHSTQTSLHKVTEDWYESINDGQIIMACFLDVKKCYDSIDHKILLNKLSSYGICKAELNWFESYLDHRQIVVNYQNHKSHSAELNIGLPQGSALGPTLFNIFINDLTQSVGPAQLNMFADDSLLYVSGENIHDVQRQLQMAINNASNWYNKNRLALNEGKTQIMIIYGNSKEPENPNEIVVNGISIPYVNSTNYLGIILDNKLNFKDHVVNVVSKTKSKLSALRRLRQFLPEKTIHLIYKTKIEPSLEYANTVWLHTSMSNIKLIQRQQNLAARIIKNNFDYENTCSSELVSELKWLTCEKRQHYQSQLLMFKAVNGLAPDYINDIVLFNFETHDYRTRNINNLSLYVPFVKKEQFRNSLQYSGAILWNQLPIQVQSAKSIDSFKKFYYDYINGF